jgi:ferredoxin-thioredoxin reductase catalytic subunit
MSAIDDTYDRLKKVNEPKGYFFNKDDELVTQLISGLLTNKERYGYMSCPCRLSHGSREDDKDIICPCDYREADVQEYGSCYCALYVSEEWNTGAIPHVTVPERRPPEKSGWGAWPAGDA